MKTPSLFPRIPHYYGDIVRGLFLLIVLATFAAIPFLGETLPFGPYFEIVGGVVLVALAGFTNPHGKVVMGLDAAAAAFGAIVLELTAVIEFSSEGMALLALRELLTLLCLIALYLSMRTLRAMAQGTIGEYPRPWEFEKNPPHAGE